MAEPGRFRVGWHPALGFLLCLLAGLGLDWGWPWRGTPWPRPLRLGLGLPPLALSLVLVGTALQRMRTARTPVEPGRAPRALVTDGPYRFSRNPLYLAQLLFLAGLGALGFPWLLPIAVVQFVLLDRLAIPREERALEELFGESYEGYRNRVRRWI